MSSFVDLGGAVWALQDFNRTREIPLRRGIRRACRTFGIDPTTKRPLVVENTAGDVTGALLWQIPVVNAGATPSGVGPDTKPPRQVPTWSFAFPASGSSSSVEQPDGSHKVQLLPIGNAKLAQDTRFAAMTANAPVPIAQGEPGIVVSATEEYDQIPIFIPGGILKAVHFGSPGSSSSVVYDLKPDGSIDPTRRAFLNSLVRVYKIERTANGAGTLFGDRGMRGLAIQMSLAKGGWAGRAVFADIPDDAPDVTVVPPTPTGPTGNVPIPPSAVTSFAPSSTGFPVLFSGFTPGSVSPLPPPQAAPSNPTPVVQGRPLSPAPANALEVLAGGSYRVGGAFHVGAGATDKHKHAVNEDGEVISVVHIDTNAKFFRSSVKDAPLRFTDEPWEDVSQSGGTWVECRIRYDKDSRHTFPVKENATEDRAGLWRIEVPIPLYMPPPPGGGGPGRPGTPPPPPPGDGGGGGGGGGPGDPLHPRQGKQGQTTGVDPNNPPPPPPGGGGDPPPGGGNPPPPVGGDPPPQGGNNPPTNQDGGTPLILQGNAFNRFNKFFKKLKPGARAKGAVNLPVMSLMNELSLPGLVIRPQSFSKNYPDLRNSFDWTPSDAAYVDTTSPAVARIEAIGPETGTSWTRTATPTRGRYAGGTGSGGFWFLPPELGAEQIFDGTVPSTLSSSFFGFYKTAIVLATPTQKGGFTSGYRIKTNTTGTQLIFDHAATNGQIDSPSPLIVDSGTGQVTAFGTVLGAGGGTSYSPCFYGDGSDGTVTFDGSTTVAGMVPAANTYTMTRDFMFSGITVNAGVTLVTNGYRLLVNGTATIAATGVVNNDATQRLSTNFGSIANGGAGGTGISVPGNGNNLGTMNVSLGGAGGKGGNAGANTGANGMAANRPSAANGTYRAMPFAMLGYVMNPNQTATWLSLNGGGGGGSGALAASATNSSSGAGGGGAGIMVFTAKTLTNNGTISANGFAGANAVAGADGIQAGGGGGGGGGALLLAYGPGSTVGTTQVNGGAFGTGGNGGANGVAGSTGTVIQLCG